MPPVVVLCVLLPVVPLMFVVVLLEDDMVEAAGLVVVVVVEGVEGIGDCALFVGVSSVVDGGFLRDRENAFVLVPRDEEIGLLSVLPLLRVPTDPKDEEEGGEGAFVPDSCLIEITAAAGTDDEDDDDKEEWGIVSFVRLELLAADLIEVGDKVTGGDLD